MAPNPECGVILSGSKKEESTQTDYYPIRRYAFVELEVGRNSYDTIRHSINYFHRAIYDLLPHKTAHKSTQTFVDPVVSKGERLAREVVFYFLQQELHLIQHDELSLCLRTVVAEMLQKHDRVFTRMVNCLNITPATAQCAITEVANHLFISGVTWGRIVALYAFASRLAAYCEEREMESLSRSIPLLMTEYIEERVAPFVANHGGWGQLCAEFPMKESVNDKVWRYLLLTGIVMGGFAVALSYIRTPPQ